MIVSIYLVVHYEAENLFAVANLILPVHPQSRTENDAGSRHASFTKWYSS